MTVEAAATGGKGRIRRIAERCVFVTVYVHVGLFPASATLIWMPCEMRSPPRSYDGTPSASHG